MKTIKFTLIILISFLSVKSAFSQTTPAEIFQKGVEDYFGAKYENAIKYFDEYVKISPNETKGYTYLGLCYLEKKDFSRAIENFSKVISIASTTSEGYIYRGNTYILQKNYTSAETDFQNAIKYDAKNVEGYIGMSRSFIAQKKYPGAEKVISSAIAVDPKNARLYITQGYINFLTGDSVKMIEDISKAMYYDSNVVFTNTKRELLKIKYDGYNSALGIADQRIKKFPKSYMSYFSRGIIYYFMNSFTKATADLKTAYDLYDGNDVKFETLLSQILRSIDRNSTK